jgi:hypothetical protein
MEYDRNNMCEISDFLKNLVSSCVQYVYGKPMYTIYVRLKHFSRGLVRFWFVDMVLSLF